MHRTVEVLEVHEYKNDTHGCKTPAITDQLKLSLVFKNSKEHLLYGVIALLITLFQIAIVNRPCNFSGNFSGMVATGRLGLWLVVE